MQSSPARASSLSSLISLSGVVEQPNQEVSQHSEVMSNNTNSHFCLFTQPIQIESDSLMELDEQTNPVPEQETRTQSDDYHMSDGVQDEQQSSPVGQGTQYSPGQSCLSNIYIF